MRIELFGFIDLESVALLNTWVVLNTIPVISIILTTEPYLHRGKFKYLLWFLFFILVICNFQLNNVIGGYLHILTFLSLVLLVITSYIGYNNWNKI